MNNRLTLFELQEAIRDSLYMSFPGFYWVTAEIMEIKDNQAGHCYLELVEKNIDSTNIRAKVRAVIWANRYRFIRLMFEDSTGETLKAGLKVLLQVKIEYHEIYGLSLVINDIDPSYTIGEMALKRQQIIKRLESEGVLSMNRELVFPVLPKRVAVISSRNAAGLTDFIKHLSENAYGYAFNIAVFDAVMQGQETEASLISALDRISEHAELFDVVVIVRGGGSQSDLSWFDSYNIAFHITQFPVPVITGIGHDKDLSVADIVAFRAVKTPTAAADFLINCMLSAEENILRLHNNLEEIALEKTEEAKKRLELIKVGLLRSAGNSIGSAREACNKLSMILNHSSIRLLSISSNELEKLKVSTELLDPVNVLKRGYTITSRNGAIIRNAGLLTAGEEIDTYFIDGTVRSTVAAVKKHSKDHK